MSDTYRQKLLNWFCSISLVLLATILSAAHDWFFELPRRAASAGSLDITDIAIASGETLILYPLFAPLFMFWHFFDFVENVTLKSAWGKKATSYAAIFGMMTVNLTLFVLMGFGLWQYNSCDQLEGVYFFQCYVRPSLWLMIPWLATLALAVLLCTIKAGFTIYLYFRKSQ